MSEKRSTITLRFEEKERKGRFITYGYKLHANGVSVEHGILSGIDEQENTDHLFRKFISERERQ